MKKNLTNLTTMFAIVLQFICLQKSFAFGPECLDLFVPKSFDYYESETLRRGLLLKAQKLLKEARSARIAATVDFQLATERKLKIFPKAAELMLDEKTELSVVKRALESEPYFAWLKSQAGYKSDPVALFIETRKDGLSPELALIRVMRDMDPTVSKKGIEAANLALHSNSIETVIVDKIISNLSHRNSTTDADPWMFMTTIREGEMHLHRLLDEQRRKHGHLIPRVAFERILLGASRNEYAVSVLGKFRIMRQSRVAESEIVSDLKTELELFAEKQGLPKTFPIERLYDVVTRIQSLKDSISYESLLADTFDPRTGALIRELRLLIEIAQGLSSKTETDSYLQSLVEP